MNAPLPSCNQPPANSGTSSRLRRGGGGDGAEGRRGRRKSWRNLIEGFGGLQAVEIPQNRQSFLWKSLEQNSLNLEKLVRMQRGPPLFRHLCSCPRAGLEGRTRAGRGAAARGEREG